MFLDNYTKEQIQIIAKESKNRREMLIKMQVSPNSGRAHQLLRKYIEENHIVEPCRTYTPNTLADDSIYIENSLASQHALRSHYKKDNFVEYKCSICGLGDIWNSQPLVLILDHIDGNNRNNTLNNLRWVCPNCNSQLPTFGNRNQFYKKQKMDKYCNQCGNHIGRSNKTGICKICYQKLRAENKNTDIKKYYQSICPNCGKNKHKYSKICKACYFKQRRNKNTNV